MDYQNGLVWRYFIEEERYTPKYRICDKFLLNKYKVNILKQYLTNEHPLIRDTIQKKI